MQKNKNPPTNNHRHPTNRFLGSSIPKSSPFIFAILISLFYENKKYMTMQKYMLRKIANFAHSPNRYRDL